MSLPEHPKIRVTSLLFVVSASIALMSFVVKTLLMAHRNELNILAMAGVKVDSQNITTYTDKLQFTAKYWTPAVLWFLFNIHLVIFARLTNGVIIPNTKIEYLIANHRNILAQTVEQTVFAVFTQMAVLPYLSVGQMINIIPLLNCFFLAGRLVFWLGYPHYRSPGVGMSMYPHAVTLLFVVAHFLQEHKILALSSVLNFVK